MTHPDDILGAVLAGGKSSRTGTDKALLPLNGVPLIQHAVKALSEVLSAVVVVADEAERFKFLSLPVVPDLVKNCGLLGGIHSALHYARGRFVLVLSCDTPFVTAVLIQYILKFETQASTKIALMHGELHPLCGLYGYDCISAVEENPARGRHKVRETLERIGCELSPVSRGSLRSRLSFRRESYTLALRIN